MTTNHSLGNPPSSKSSGITVGPAAAERLGAKSKDPSKLTPTQSVNLETKNMGKVAAIVAARTIAEAQNIAVMLSKAGVVDITTRNKLAELRTDFQNSSPDILIVGADLDHDIFDFIRDIRHGKVGVNPFLLITTLVDGDQFDAVKKIMQAGTDDIIVRPVKEDQLLQRLRRVTVNRQAFVVTSDYLGPDRRVKNRPSSIRRIQVLNTVLEKASGKDLQAEDMHEAVAGSMNEVLHARLDSNSYRLGFVCHIILDAYRINTITPEVKEKILVLVEVLRDAAKTAERVNETELGLLCGSLAKEVEGVAERYEHPTERDIKLIQKLTRAVMMAVKPHVPLAQLEKETRDAAENYLRHQREQFESSAEIHRNPEDEPIELVDEAVLEILPVAKGQTVFKQGDAATAAYILASGSIAIYREIDGKQVPVSRIRKGEFFGEMAIIDGTPRRATAVALEDCTLSLIAKATIEEKMAAADPVLAKIMHILIDNVRAVPEHFVPKARNVEDISAEIEAQRKLVHRTLDASGSAALVTESQALLARLDTLSAEICSLLRAGAASDPRLSVRPPTPENKSPAEPARAPENLE